MQMPSPLSPIQRAASEYTLLDRRKGTGRKSADTVRLKYTPEEIRQQKAKGGSLSTPGGFGWLKKNDPARFAQIIAEREARRKAKSAKT